MESGARLDLGEAAAARLVLEGALGNPLDPASLVPGDGARLRIAFSQAAGETVHREWTPAEFAEGAAVDYRARGGFWEKATFERLEQFGSIAHCWSVFESIEGDATNAPFARGINSIQLVQTDEGWRIAHLLWDIEQAHNPIPSDYAGGAAAP